MGLNDCSSRDDCGGSSQASFVPVEFPPSPLRRDGGRADTMIVTATGHENDDGEGPILACCLARSPCSSRAETGRRFPGIARRKVEGGRGL